MGGVGESRGVFSLESFRPGKSSSESKLISSLLGFALPAKTHKVWRHEIIDITERLRRDENKEKVNEGKVSHLHQIL